MSHDIVADTLNMIKNAKKRNKNEIVAARYSKLLLNVLEIAKREGYIKSIDLGKEGLKIRFDESLNDCNAIKPRYFVKKEDIEKYVRRYLPARDFGFIIVSTNNGLLTHKEAMKKEVGGCLVAYFY